MSADINLYESHPEAYIELQNLRPDYRSAIETTVTLTTKYLADRGKISVVDFCGGIGNVTREISEHVPISKAAIIDINEEFLNIAEASHIKAEKIEAIHSDILDVKLEEEFDLVLSVFAYHHVPDNQKEKYFKIARSGLKEGGFLVLTEIYLPNKELTTQYYKKLLDEISTKNPLLERFLTETANSTDFEFKVSKEFADKQLKSLGFKAIEGVKIWPLDQTFGDNIGTFVQVFQS